MFDLLLMKLVCYRFVVSILSNFQKGKRKRLVPRNLHPSCESRKPHDVTTTVDYPPYALQISSYLITTAIALSSLCCLYRTQGMTGKGWTWIGTDGATTSTFADSPNLRQAMQGMVGTRPKHGEGALYQRLLKTWKEKDAAKFPGLIHSPRVLEVRSEILSVLRAIRPMCTAQLDCDVKRPFPSVFELCD